MVVLNKKNVQLRKYSENRRKFKAKVVFFAFIVVESISYTKKQGL